MITSRGFMLKKTQFKYETTFFPIELPDITHLSIKEPAFSIDWKLFVSDLVLNSPKDLTNTSNALIFFLYTF